MYYNLVEQRDVLGRRCSVADPDVTRVTCGTTHKRQSTNLTQNTTARKEDGLTHILQNSTGGGGGYLRRTVCLVYFTTAGTYYPTLERSNLRIRTNNRRHSFISLVVKKSEGSEKVRRKFS